MGMGAIRQGWGAGEAALLAVEAGADVLLYGADPGSGIPVFDEVFTALLGAVRTGRIAEKRIDESVLRILSVKAQIRILDDPFPRSDWREVLEGEEHLKISREIAEKSVTQVRNEGKLLPLSENARIPLILPEKYAKAALPLLRAVPQFVPLYVESLEEKNSASPPLSPEEMREIRRAPVFALASWGLPKSPELRRIIKDFGEKPLIFLALRSPYDLLEVPEAKSSLCTYGDTPVSLEVLGEILRGERLPRGELPVELPGMYPRRWGLKSW
ncbi:MAG TPA: glycoside hydrolase family 3 N-terminal domain-containing protein, partial [Synergistaceae bacterium]|nr:glycoside hydrolase family 3 N-terminal domain-containing protein [Synergistaceae bacterium]